LACCACAGRLAPALGNLIEYEGGVETALRRMYSMISPEGCATALFRPCSSEKAFDSSCMVQQQMVKGEEASWQECIEEGTGHAVVWQVRLGKASSMPLLVIRLDCEPWMGNSSKRLS